MTCIFTGCRVHFPAYGQTVTADAYTVGNTVLFRFYPEQWRFPAPKEFAPPHDYSVEFGNHPTDSFWREDLGIGSFALYLVTPLSDKAKRVSADPDFQ